MISISNEEMVNKLLASGYADGRVASAMKKVDRALFVPQEFEERAYYDAPLPIGFDQTISAPSIVAIMSKELDVKEGMKVLEVGCGSGYQAAILAELVGPKGRVITIERIPALVDVAKGNLSKMHYKNITILCGDGTKGYSPEAPYDRIIATGAAPAVPEPLVEQLKRGGRLVIPIGSKFWQDLILIEKDDRIRRRVLLPVIFVPLIGKHGFK